MATTPIDFSSIGGKPVEPSSFDFSAIGGKKVEPTHDAKIKAAPKEWSVPWLKEKLYNIADSLTEGLPAAGATGGAMIGAGAGSGVAPGPGTAAGAIGGAGIGGMAGEALKQHLRRALGFEVPTTGEDAAKEITKQGVIQGGTQAVTEALPMAAPALQKAALGQYERALAPTTKINKALTEKIAPEMVDRGIHGSLGGIEKQATAAADSIKPELDAAYNAIHPSKTAGAGTDIFNTLENLKSKYVVQGKVANPQAVNAIEGVQDIIKQYGADIDPKSLRQLKKIFDDPVAAKGGFAGADLTTQYAAKAQKTAANSIRSILSQASPDVAALNKEMKFWLDVQRVTGQSALRQTGQQGGLLKVLGPLGMAGAGAAGFAGHGASTSMEAAAISGLVTAVGVASRTARWRTSSALLKNSLADALASGNVSRASALLARLGVAVAEAKPASGTGDQTAEQ